MKKIRKIIKDGKIVEKICYKDEQYSKADIVYRFRVSQQLFGRLNRACRCLDVKQKNLVLFLVSIIYDTICKKEADEYKQMIQNALKEYDANKRKADAAQKTNSNVSGCKTMKTKELNFRVTEFVDDYIQQLATICGVSRYRIVIAMIWMSQDVLPYMLNDYQATASLTEDMEYTFSKDTKYFLDCIGIAPNDFSILAQAYILSALFMQSGKMIRGLSDYGFYNYQRLSRGKATYKPRAKK